MAIPRTPEQIELMKKYSALKREWMKRGVKIGVFDFVAQKIIIEMKDEELARRIREQFK